MMEPNEEIPDSSGSCAFSFVKSSHGGRVLIQGGYRHLLKRTNKNGTSVWECHIKKTCKGFAVLNADEKCLVRRAEHSCVPDFESIEIERKIIDLKEKVKSDYRPIPMLYKKEMKKIMTDDYADKLQPFHCKKDALYKARQESTKISCFQTCADVELPDNISENFLCVQDDDILIFIIEECKQWIAGIKLFFSDGTFKVAPSPYKQLYTVHGDLGSDDEHTRVVPCIYALLPNKQQGTYERMFKAIKLNIPNFEPVLMKIDFETAAINAIKTIYPKVTVSGCYFHYTQALYKKANDLEITNTHEGARYIAKCAALAHLPALKIHEGWLTVVNASPEGENIKAFNTYMSKQWIQFDMIRILSCYGHRHRTNNVVESYHKSVNKRIHKNTNLLFFITQLKEEARMVNFINMQNEMGQEISRKRNRKYTKMDSKIQQIVNNYLEGKTTLEKCISLLSCLKYN